MDYQIKPIAVEGFADADGVHVNQSGAWLGEVDWRTDGDTYKDAQYIAIYSDEDGDFVPAPDNWRELIVKKLD